MEDDEEKYDSSGNKRSKLDEEENLFGDFQNNYYDSDKDKDGNYGDDTIFVDNLVWEDIDNYLVIPYIPDHYCGPHGFKEGVKKLFQTIIEYIMITSNMLLEYFLHVTVQSKTIAWLR